MDVLDHSCSKLGFGGKMCIDGTFKFDEEQDENFRSQISDVRYDIDQIILNKFPEVRSINISLLKKKSRLY